MLALSERRQSPSVSLTELLGDSRAEITGETDVTLADYAEAPKHQLADPALAAQILGVQAAALAGQSAGPVVVRDGPLLGSLFESLATLSTRVYTGHREATVGHFRTARGRQEVDLIVERADGRVVAIEVKLARDVSLDDGKHLRWLKQRLGTTVLDQVIITTGPAAYRREDGIAVVPLALLGP